VHAEETGGWVHVRLCERVCVGVVVGVGVGVGVGGCVCVCVGGWVGGIAEHPTPSYQELGPN